MSGHAYFGINKEKIKHISFYKDGVYHKIRKAWLFTNGTYQQVWSGASVVSYYDGDTLMGTEEIDEGNDTLHPSFSTTKANYTLVGWSTVKNDLNHRVTNMPATGEPMNLYALYLPNTLTVVSASGSGGQSDMPAYSLNTKNEQYVTGGVNTQVEIWYRAGRESSSATFTLNKGGFYQTATATIWSASRGNGTAKFDGGTIASNSNGWTSSYTSRTLANGNHTVEVGLYVDESQGSSWYGVGCGIVSLVLSNPTAWE